MTLVIAIFCFPANPAPDATSMNYTSLLLGGYILICLAYYYVPVYGGKYWFKGPVGNVESSEGAAYSSDESGSEREKDGDSDLKAV